MSVENDQFLLFLLLLIPSAIIIIFMTSFIRVKKEMKFRGWNSSLQTIAFAAASLAGGHEVIKKRRESRYKSVYLPLPVIRVRKCGTMLRSMDRKKKKKNYRGSSKRSRFLRIGFYVRLNASGKVLDSLAKIAQSTPFPAFNPQN